MTQDIYKKKIEEILGAISKKGTIPSFASVTTIESLNFVTISEKPLNGEIISESLFQGCDRDVHLATLKALVEYVERKAFLECKENGRFGVNINMSSDGFAGYPVSGQREYAELKARENSYLEAFERIVWSNWWDNPEYGFNCTNIDRFSSDLHPDLGLIFRMNVYREIERLMILSPLVENNCFAVNDVELLIIIAKFKGGGFITGGAAGKVKNRDNTITHAANELIRHIVALGRFEAESAEPNCMYHRVLLFFGLGNGDSIVEHRLGSVGSKSFCLPNISLDCEVEHRFQDVCIVWRSMFEGQPDFINKKVERLCI